MRTPTHAILALPFVLLTGFCIGADDGAPADAVAAIEDAQNRDSWLGKRVFWKETATPKRDGEIVRTEQIRFPAMVEAVDGERLWLVRAWVHKNDVRDAQQALDYYTEQTRQNPADALSWARRGTVWTENGDFDAAVKDCSEAIRLAPQLSQAFMYRGIARYKNGNLDDALQDFAEALRLDSKNAPTYVYRGYVRGEKGDLDAAIADFTEAIRLDPKDRIAYWGRATARAGKKEFPAAVKDYTAAIRLDPYDAQSYSGRGDARLGMDNHAAAIKDYTAAIRLNPLDADSYKGRGNAREAQGQYANGISDLTKAIQLDPKDAEAYGMAAWHYATSFDPAFRDGKKAVELATKACELSKGQNPDVLETLAAAYARTGQWESAIERQKQAIKNYADDPVMPDVEYRLTLYEEHRPFRIEPRGVNHNPWLNQMVFWTESAVTSASNDEGDVIRTTFPAMVEDVKGEWLYLREGRLRKRDAMEAQEALDYYAEKIRLNPSDSSLWTHRASIMRARGELDAAIKDFTEAIRLDPTAAHLYGNRGRIWQTKRDYDAALNDFNEAIRLDPEDAAAYYDRGTCWNKKSNKDAAMKDYTDAIRLDPDAADAYFERGLISSERGDNDAAIKDYTAVIRVDPKNGRAYNNRGAVWSEKREYSKAIDDLTAALRFDPSNALRFKNLAWMLAACPDEKLRAGKKAVELATKACQLTNWTKWHYISILAAAHAESGDWDEAIRRQEQAIEMAPDNDKPAERESLEMYKQHKPYQ